MSYLRLMLAALVKDVAYLSFRCFVLLVILLGISVQYPFAQDPEARERNERGGDPVVRRLEVELQKAIGQNNQAEVAEIRALLLKLGRSDVRGGSPNELLQVPFHINCGGGGESESEAEGSDEGRVRSQVRSLVLRRLPDQPFDERAGYGFNGGQARQNWFSAIWGAEEGGLYRSVRVNPGSYQFKLPAGDYIVAVGISETIEHTAGRRVFDVQIQDAIVAKDLDPFAVAGNAQAFRLVHAAKVRANEGLTIRFLPVSGADPIVNAIWVYPRTAEPIRTPGNFHGAGSYAMNALFWDHPPQSSVAGYLIERRATGATNFTSLFEKPVPVSRWLDDLVVPGTNYEYQIRSVNVDGAYSGYSPTVSLTPKSFASSTLPVYSIKVPAEALKYMLSNVHEDRDAEGNLLFNGVSYPVQMRIRGASTRQASKKSYRIEFTADRPEGRPKVIYLKAEPQDPTLQQEKLTCDVFSAMGLPVSQADYVNVQLNGSYQGIYLDIEPIRSPFKKRAGLDVNGTLIRAASFQHLGREAPGELSGNDGSLEELSEFIRQVNRTDRGEFEAFVRSATDWDRVRDYLIASMLTHRSEIEATDYFYYRDPKTLHWSLIPWDHNNGNFGMRGPGSGPEEPFIALYGQTLQTTGPLRSYWYVLPTRILNNDALRKEYFDALAAAVNAWLVSGRVDEMANRNFQILKDEALLDPYRWRPGHDTPFLTSPAKLKSFNAAHGRRLLDMIAEQARQPLSAVVINEFQFTRDTAWVELHNRGRGRVSLAGYTLGDIEKPRRPQHRFAAGEFIEPGEFKRVTLSRRNGEGVFDSQGGAVALIASPPGREGREGRGEDERAEEEERGGSKVIDFYQYGHQDSRYSYGRSGTGFGFMSPTPGRDNPTQTLLPPPLLADGGVQWKDGKPQAVTAILTALCPSDPPQSVVLHLQRGGRWQELPMTISGAQAVAMLPTAVSTDELRYYFVATAANGLTRHAPLTAPSDSYLSQRPEK